MGRNLLKSTHRQQQQDVQMMAGAGGDHLPRNFSWIIPGAIAGCAVPQSEFEIISLVRNGITLLVTLSEEQLPHSSVQSIKDLNHKIISWKEFEDISTSELESILNCIEKEISSGGKVAIHCRMRRGRTGTLLAAFIMKHNKITANKAISYVRGLR